MRPERKQRKQCHHDSFSYNQKLEESEAFGQKDVVRMDPEEDFPKLCKCRYKKHKANELDKAKILGLRDRNLNEEVMKENEIAPL